MSKKKESRKSTKFEMTDENVFESLELDQSEELQARAELLREVSRLIKNSGLTQREVAQRLGIRQPKVSMLISRELWIRRLDRGISFRDLRHKINEVRSLWI